VVAVGIPAGSISEGWDNFPPLFWCNMNWNVLNLDRRDLTLFGIVLLASGGVYLYTSSSFIVMNALVSFIFTFVPARYEKLKR
jgi:hypothetical protein